MSQSVNIDPRVRGDLFAVSLLPQTDASTAATLSRKLLVDQASGFQKVVSVEDNREDATGYNEPTDIDVLGIAGEGTLTLNKPTPDQVAWAMRMAVALPNSATVSNAEYHTFKLLDYPTELPYFTLAHRKGGGSVNRPASEWERHIGVSIPQVVLNAQRDEFMSLALTCAGVGRGGTSRYTEVFDSQDFTAGNPSVVLQYDVEGTDAAGYLEHVQVLVDNVSATAALHASNKTQYSIEASLVSYTPGTNTLVISNSSPAISGTKVVKVIYQVADDDTSGDFDWVTAAAATTSLSEYKMKSGNIRILMGSDPGATNLALADWSDHTTFNAVSAGISGACDVQSLQWTLNRNGAAQQCWRSDAYADSLYAQSVELGDTEQELVIDRLAMDWLLDACRENIITSGASIETNWSGDYFGVELNSYGPYITGTDDDDRLGIRIYWPRCKIVGRESTVADNKHRYNWTIRPLVDTTANVPSMGVVISNNVASYL